MQVFPALLKWWWYSYKGSVPTTFNEAQSIIVKNKLGRLYLRGRRFGCISINYQKPQKSMGPNLFSVIESLTFLGRRWPPPKSQAALLRNPLRHGKQNTVAASRRLRDGSGSLYGHILQDVPCHQGVHRVNSTRVQAKRLCWDIDEAPPVPAWCQ